MSEEMIPRANYSAWDIEPLRAGHFSKESLYRNLVGWAILAASAHNVQPWKFILRPSKNSIDVLVDSAGILPASDKTGRQAWISVGCSVSNLIIAAEYCGLNVDLEFVRNGIRLNLDEPRQLVKRKGKQATLDAIKRRRVNRGDFYSGPEYEIPDKIIRKMRNTAEALGIGLEVITDAKRRAELAELQYEAERFAMLDGAFRNELAEFVLPNDTERGRGMPGNTLGLTDAMALHAHSELKKHGIFDPTLAVGMASGSRDNIRNSPLACIIWDDLDSPGGWIKAGRAFQEIALLAEMNDLSVSVHAGIIELFDENIFSRRYYADEFLKIVPLSSGRPLVLFRMGYAKEYRPHSPRLSVDEVSEIM